MKILSWNILSSLWVYKSDREYKKMSDRDLDPMRRAKMVVKKLLQHDAEVVLLQEVTETEYKYISEKLEEKGYYVSRLVNHSKHHWKRYIYEDHTYEPNGNVVAVKTLDDKKVHVYRVKLSTNGNYCAVLNVKNHGWFISVHLDDLSKQLRNKQVSTLLRWLNKRAKKNELVVIGGDFNAKPEEHVHKILRQHNFYTLITHIMNHDKNSYALPPYGLYDFIYVNFLSNKMRLDIDDKDINSSNQVSNEVETIKKYGSDHYPVIISF